VDLSFVTGQSFVLLMVDLDHFKRVNDSHGHSAGDDVLKAVANALVRAFPRHADFVARYGGEEFAAVLVDVDPRAVGMLGGRALTAIRGLTVDYEGAQIEITCSVGAASHIQTESGEALLKRADAALYEAKDNGRNRLVVSRP
jgi:diguanylate cyclase (GGDEF)-like protein